ncbi:hypothetical protein BGAL_0920g00010 [Botrytis galanthina]|uniref:Delta 8-(E)-sphingolipid desaturase n=1 Tax=Botrytis galanthina TaxID=278940 RepID=A0A4S8QKB3_9HELO|nr:hypothetical protein BGAL_0920g00010 [Botrytis galanthina]
MSTPTPSQHRLISRPEIKSLIAKGHKIFILNNSVIKADAWLPFHPGGEKSILHMIGRDATDEINALHSEQARERMRKYVVGRIEGRWENFLPPIQGGNYRVVISQEVADESLYGEEDSRASGNFTSPLPVFYTGEIGTEVRLRCTGVETQGSRASSFSSMEMDKAHVVSAEALTAHAISTDLSRYPSLDRKPQDEIVLKYRQLDEKLRSEGLYNCPYSSYGIDMVRYGVLFALFWTFLQSSYYAFSGLFLGLFWHQLVFTAHDAGHMGITHGFHTDSCIGIFIADFLGGLSIGWWKRNHNIHRIVTNSPEHDPDIEHMPFFAISHRFFSSLYSTYYDRNMRFDAASRFFIKHQTYLYYPILLLGRFNLYVLAWSYLLSPNQVPRKGPAWWHRHLEIAGQIFFLVLVRLSHALLAYSYMVVPYSIPPNIAYDHGAAARPTNAQPLRHVDFGPGSR